MRLLRATFCQVLNLSKDEDSTTSPANLFQYLTILMVMKFLLVPNQNLPFSNLSVVSCPIAVHLEKNMAPSSPYAPTKLQTTVRLPLLVLEVSHFFRSTK